MGNWTVKGSVTKISKTRCLAESWFFKISPEGRVVNQRGW